MDLIEDLKKNLKMEIRDNSKEEEYLEAVIDRNTLDALNSTLARYLGPALKEPGKKAVYPKEIKNLVDSIGGLRPEQSFFYKKENQKILYAALWPWQSDPQKITLKIGAVAETTPAQTKNSWWKNLGLS